MPYSYLWTSVPIKVSITDDFCAVSSHPSVLGIPVIVLLVTEPISQGRHRGSGRSLLRPQVHQASQQGPHPVCPQRGPHPPPQRCSQARQTGAAELLSIVFSEHEDKRLP